MEKMLNIFIVASILSLVGGKQYAYFGNDLVEFDDVSTNSISAPYPYQVPKVVTVEQRPINSYGVAVQTSTQVQKSQEACLSPLDLICTVITSVYGYTKSIIMLVLKTIPTFIFGCFSFFGVCKLTSICNYFNIDILSYADEITSFVTSERLKRATEFVQTAYQKYRELQ